MLREVIRAMSTGLRAGYVGTPGRGWSGTVIMIIFSLFPFSYKILFRYRSKSPKEGEVKKKKCSESSTQPLATLYQLKCSNMSEKLEKLP